MAIEANGMELVAKAAGAKKHGDRFVFDGGLYVVNEPNIRPMYSRVSDGDLDIRAMVAELGDVSPAVLARVVSIAAEAARDKWGAGDEFKAFAKVPIGDGPQARVHELGSGKHPNSRRDNTHYVRAHVGKDGFVGFDGHRFPWHIELTESNYMKQSYLSGDEVRKACAARIYMTVVVPDGPRESKAARKLVYTTGGREAEYLLTKLAALLPQLSEHPVELWKGGPGEFPALVGRKVFWHDEPGTVTRYLPDQGAVVIEPASGSFKKPAWRMQDPDDIDDSDDTYAKADLFDGGIWWFRKG